MLTSKEQYVLKHKGPKNLSASIQTFSGFFWHWMTFGLLKLSSKINKISNNPNLGTDIVMSKTQLCAAKEYLEGSAMTDSWYFELQITHNCLLTCLLASYRLKQCTHMWTWKQDDIWQPWKKMPSTKIAPADVVWKCKQDLTCFKWKNLLWYNANHLRQQ